MIRSSLSISLVALGLLSAAAAAQGRATAACCSITAIDAANGVVSARVTASGHVFEFKARSPSTLATLRVGQTVHANFSNNQVSIDGRTVCCTVTKAPGPPVAVRQPPAPPNTPGGNRPITTAPVNAVASVKPPAISYGAPIPHTPNSKRAAVARYVALPAPAAVNHTLTASVAGRGQVTHTVLHLRGLDAIENAPNSVPDGVRRLLEIHARKTPAGQHTHYIVDPAIAQAWARDNPVPEEIKVKSGGKCKGNEWERFRCRTDKSWDNWSELTSEQWEELRKKAQGWWDDIEKTWKQCTVADGWKDEIATGPTAPVRISEVPQMTVSMQQSSARGSAKGTVTGSATLGFPIEADLEVAATFFYIPCLPGVYRLRSLTGKGTLTTGQQLTLGVTASGAFDKQYTIPPGGGPQIPLYVIPIVIGQVPVAVIDVSLYIEGDLRIHGEGQAAGSVGVTHTERSTVEFECSGKGCGGKRYGQPAVTTTNQSAQIQGEVSVQPGIYTALQLSFDYNVLQGRAGPEPFLLGVANGCGAVSATQSGGTSTSQTNTALTADLDWGIFFRAEALVAGQKVGNAWEPDNAKMERHIWFGDLLSGGSTALVPTVTGPAQAVAAQPAAVKVRMPSCYPYDSKVQYRLTWDGGATPAAPGNACNWQPGSGTCWFEPGKDLALSLTWATPGAYTLSVQLVKDDHNRSFAPAPAPGKLSVTVGAAASGGQQ